MLGRLETAEERAEALRKLETIDPNSFVRMSPDLENVSLWLKANHGHEAIIFLTKHISFVAIVRPDPA